METVLELAKRCKTALPALRTAGSADKNCILETIGKLLRSEMGSILQENQKDIEAARSGGLPGAMIDRLTLTEVRIDGMIGGIHKIIALPDPTALQDGAYRHPSGMLIARQRVPLGVAGIIYESRPNVTVDTAVLCLKAGNACLLRGGKEAFYSNLVLSNLIRRALRDCGFPSDLVCFVSDTARSSALEMMGLCGLLDVLIPRGGAGLIRTVVENARVPVIETGVGNCHIYVDEKADLSMALSILENAKISRPSVCNAAETLLVARSAAKTFLPMVREKMPDVTLHGCPETIAVLGEGVCPVTERDYAEEYLSLDLAVRVVDGLEEAIEHIARYSSGHSECIVTESYKAARFFCERVDAAAVYVNASTRFTDGEEFGLGAEIGISTQKLHARGPMGLQHLTTIKYIIQGDGQIR